MSLLDFDFLKQKLSKEEIERKKIDGETDINHVI